MTDKIEHIGIAVTDLSVSCAIYEQLLGVSPYKLESVLNEGVDTAFFKVGTSKIELVSANKADSVISKFIHKKGEGIHHLAFEVPDIVKEMQRLSALGFTLVNDVPKVGADNKLVCFVHPKNTSGVLIELCQEI